MPPLLALLIALPPLAFADFGEGTAAVERTMEEIEAESKIRDRLREPVELSAGTTTLEEFAQELARVTGLTVLVREYELADLNIALDEEFENLSGPHPAARHLEVALTHRVGDLEYVVESGLVWITTEEDAGSVARQRVYDITDLVSDRSAEEVAAFREAAARKLRSDAAFRQAEDRRRGESERPDAPAAGGGLGGAAGGAGGGGFFSFGGGGGGFAPPPWPAAELSAVRVPLASDRTTADEVVRLVAGRLDVDRRTNPDQDVRPLTLEDRTLLVVTAFDGQHREVARLLAMLTLAVED